MSVIRASRREKNGGGERKKKKKEDLFRSSERARKGKGRSSPTSPFHLHERSHIISCLHVIMRREEGGKKKKEKGGKGKERRISLHFSPSRCLKKKGKAGTEIDCASPYSRTLISHEVSRNRPEEKKEKEKKKRGGRGGGSASYYRSVLPRFSAGPGKRGGGKRVWKLRSWLTSTATTSSILWKSRPTRPLQRAVTGGEKGGEKGAVELGDRPPSPFPYRLGELEKERGKGREKKGKRCRPKKRAAMAILVSSRFRPSSHRREKEGEEVMFEMGLPSIIFTT